jgi:hypothetical protein
LTFVSTSATSSSSAAGVVVRLGFAVVVAVESESS